jgi:hypothetical protein
MGGVHKYLPGGSHGPPILSLCLSAMTPEIAQSMHEHFSFQAAVIKQ